MRALFQKIKQQFLKGNDLVLVSVTASSGSTPRGAGSRMLVNKNGRVTGTIGGGAVEYRAECMALDILEKKESCEHQFLLNRKDVENIGMICGGDVTVFFQYEVDDTGSTFRVEFGGWIGDNFYRFYATGRHLFQNLSTVIFGEAARFTVYPNLYATAVTERNVTFVIDLYRRDVLKHFGS